MKGCFFGKKPPPEIDFHLRLLDTDDILELSGLYGEARDRFKSPALMNAVNEKMEAAIDKLKREKPELWDRQEHDE